MSQPYLGQITTVGFNFAPKGYALCNGQLMSIQQNAALFSILGTMYGGDGVRTFGLPNLQGRVPIHFNDNYPEGSASGESNHTLLVSEMPAHNHTPSASNAAASVGVPTGAFWAKETDNAYAAAPSGQMLQGAIGPSGSSQPHNNMQPYLVITFVIALIGIFPTRT